MDVNSVVDTEDQILASPTSPNKQTPPRKTQKLPFNSTHDRVDSTQIELNPTQVALRHTR